MKELDIVRETETLSLELEGITEIEREVVLLAVLFFGAKRKRLKIAQGEHRVIEPELKPEEPSWLTILRWSFAQAREEFSDIEGDIVGFVTSKILESPVRKNFFPYLGDKKIERICAELNKMFENQEFCAQCESWSYYQIEPEEFQFFVAADMIYLCANNLGIPELYKWKGYINGKKRTNLVKKIIKNYSPKPGYHELLAPQNKSKNNQ